MNDIKTNYPWVKKLGLVLGPVLFLLLYNAPFTILDSAADKVIAVAVWMIVWWVTEAVSISVTALIPLTIFPLIGVMNIKNAAANYGSSTVFLFFGGFVMALALEKVNLHKRIALNIIRLTGTSPNRVILGFMIATASLSMWISNTATTVVMLPIALSVVHLFNNDSNNRDKNFSLSLMLSIAYSANVGGVATLIGTPPNLVIAGFMESEYGVQISFVKWMMMGVPFACLMLALSYFVLVKWVFPNNLQVSSQNNTNKNSDSNDQSRSLINSELAKLGVMSSIEKRVLLIFAMTICLWVLRANINEWQSVIRLSDTGISMLAALCLFAVPHKFSQGEFVLQWQDTVKLPWGILILFGGGLALAAALSQAGVINAIGAAVSQNGNLSAIVLIAALVVIVLFMTELMSNVALVSIFAPVVAGIALGLDAQVLHFLIPVAMAASCAFMLPMATPPNAIVFASGHIKVHEMARVGVILNVLSVLILIGFAKVVIPYLF